MEASLLALAKSILRHACTHFASIWRHESYEHACLVFTLNFESRALLNILRGLFAFHFGGLYLQKVRFFAKMSEESVIDCVAEIAGRNNSSKNYLNETPNPMEAVMKEFSVHSWRLECTLSVSTIIEKKERLF